MNSWLIQKLHIFFGVWLIYLVQSLLIALIGTFLVVPLVLYLRFGVIQFLPDPAFGLLIVKAFFYASLVLAVVMWLYAEWETMEQSKQAALGKKQKTPPNHNSPASPTVELRDMRNTITVSDPPLPSSTHTPTLSALARGTGAQRSKPSADKSSASSGQ
jgi:hypothetical protein